MKEIKSDELFANLTTFLKDKGIELTEGSYSQRIRQGCDLLADAVNLTQAGLARAKAEIDEKLEHMRRIIHEKTAPKTPAASPKRPRAATPRRKKAPANKTSRAVRKSAPQRRPRNKAV
ncbi:MAG: hypothetical protein IPM17_12980 [Verrucomicrobia bacterium]|nr:hypothetical protein [Verrucomicrobiota bacterium]